MSTQEKSQRRWLNIIPRDFPLALVSIFSALSLSELVRGALTFSVLPTYGSGVLGLPVEITALAISLHYLMDTLFRTPFGWMIDRIGPRYPLMAGFVAALCAVIFMFQARTGAMLLLAAMLFGFGVSPMWPAAMSAIAHRIEPQERASYVGYLYLFWLCGTGLGPVLANLLIARSYPAAFLALGLADGLGLLVVLLFVHNRQYRAHDSVRISNKYSWQNRIQSILTNVREASYLFPGMFAQTFAITSLVPILSLYAKLELHLSPIHYTGILVSGGALTALTLIPAGKLVDRFGARYFLIFGFGTAAFALIVFSFYHSRLATYLVVAFIGIAYGFVLPSWNKTVDTHIDPDKKATLWGIFMTVEGIGSAVGPYVGGLVWQTLSPEAPFWVAGSVILLICLLYIFVPLQKKDGGRESIRHRQRSTF